MPQLVAGAIISYAGGAAAIGATAATAITVASYATFLVAGVASARHQQRKLLRQQNAELRDRTVTVRGSAEPQVAIIGRTRVGGVQLAPGWTSGTDNEVWTIPFAFAGHEVTSFDDIWFDDASVGALVGTAVPPGSRWYKSKPELRSVEVAGGGVGATYTVPGGAQTVRIETIAYEASGNPQLPPTTQMLVAGTHYTVARNGNQDLVVTYLADMTGKTLVYSYIYEAGSPKAYIRKFLGSAAGERDTDLEANSGGQWTANCVGKNIARLHIALIYDSDVYPAGPPNPSAIISGAKMYDPRLDSTNGGSGAHRFADPTTWAWSDNPALAFAWYMTWSGGLGCTSAQIDWPSIITAANICDEQVTLAGGGTHSRYSCNGVLSTADDVRVNVDKILSSMVGTRFYSGGKWYVRAGAYVTPTVDFADGDFADGSVTILPRAKRRDLFNAIKGTFVDDHAAGAQGGTDAGGFYQLTDFEPYVSSTYKAEDGGEELWEDIELPMTHDWRRAQRIAKLILYRARQALRIEASFQMGAYGLQPGDTCRITSSINGWTNKVFRVVDRIYQPHGDVRLVLQEEASAVYSWIGGEEEVTPDPAPNTLLPDPRNVAPLANFALSAGDSYTLPDGTVVPYCEATWSPITDSAVLLGGRIEVWWKRAIDLAMRKIEARPDATSLRIEPVSGGDTITAQAWVWNGSQVKGPSVFATRTMRGDLPSTETAPVSYNMLPNAAFETSTARWTTLWVNEPAFINGQAFGTFPDGGRIPGPVSNGIITALSTLIGAVGSISLVSPQVAVKPGDSYVAFASLHTFQSDAYVRVGFSDASGNWVGWGATSSVVPYAPGVWTPTQPGAHVRVSSRGVAPAGAVTASLVVTMNGGWVNTAGNARYCSVYQPFLGPVPASSRLDPEWAPGGPQVSGPQIDEGAATWSNTTSLGADRSYVILGPPIFSVDLPTDTPAGVPVNCTLAAYCVYTTSYAFYYTANGATTASGWFTVTADSTLLRGQGMAIHSFTSVAGGGRITVAHLAGSPSSPSTQAVTQAQTTLRVEIIKR